MIWGWIYNHNSKSIIFVSFQSLHFKSLNPDTTSLFLCLYQTWLQSFIYTHILQKLQILALLFSSPQIVEYYSIWLLPSICIFMFLVFSFPSLCSFIFLFISPLFFFDIISYLSALLPCCCHAGTLISQLNNKQALATMRILITRSLSIIIDQLIFIDLQGLSSLLAILC